MWLKIRRFVYKRCCVFGSRRSTTWSWGRRSFLPCGGILFVGIGANAAITVAVGHIAAAAAIAIIMVAVIINIIAIIASIRVASFRRRVMISMV